MSIEQRVSEYLNKMPGVKRYVKRVYQFFFYMISDKKKSEGNIIKVSPDDDYDYFFGYYDKSPWDTSGRYMLCLRARNTWSEDTPKEKADIVIIDTNKDYVDPERYRIVAQTNTWNVQQGCMLQWLGPDYKSNIIFNDYRNGKYVSIIKNINSLQEREIAIPIYSVSRDGKMALSLDFSRLYNLRPGYGYHNVEEETKGIPLPDTTAIWSVDLSDGHIQSLLQYSEFAEYLPRSEMKKREAVHKVNHIMISPDGSKFMVLYRWFNGSKKFSRLMVCDIDGSNMRMLLDDDMVSHCCWKDDNTILAYAKKKDQGTGYYLIHDNSDKCERVWNELTVDGHPSYSPDGKWVVTDTYADRARMCRIILLNKNEIRTVAKVFEPFKYDNETRCDLHPRWSRDGEMICFDAAFEGRRGMYVLRK